MTAAALAALLCLSAHHLLLSVNCLPDAAGPILKVLSNSYTSISLSWEDPESGAQINGYHLDFSRLRDNETRRKSLPAHLNSFTLEGLDCGATYELRLTAFHGNGQPGGLHWRSESIVVTTLVDQKIVSPRKRDLLKINQSKNSYIILLNEWPTYECPVDGFRIELREVQDSKWISVEVEGDGSDPEGVPLPFLEPGLWYQISVAAKLGGRFVSQIYGVVGLLSDGGIPPSPPKKIMIVERDKEVFILVDNWDSVDCPVQRVTMEYKRDEKDDEPWQKVKSQQLQDDNSVTFTKLEFETAYRLRLNRTTCAGITVDEFPVKTLRVDKTVERPSSLFTVGPSFFTFHWSQLRWFAVCPVRKWLVSVALSDYPEREKRYETAAEDVAVLRISRLTPSSNYVVQLTAVTCGSERALVYDVTTLAEWHEDAEGQNVHYYREAVRVKTKTTSTNNSEKTPVYFNLLAVLGLLCFFR